jgi:hypothetical protein
MGREVKSRISLGKGKKEQSQDQFSSVNPEFIQDGIVGASIFAKHKLLAVLTTSNS